MTAFNEINLNNQDENLRTGNTGNSASENDNPFNKPENPLENGRVNMISEDEQSEDEAFGENSGILNSNIMNDYSVSPGPGDDDDDLTDDDDLSIDDDDDDTLIPIEEDDDDSLDTEEDDDIVPGTDMDDDDLVDDDDDMDEDTSVTRSSTSDMGSSVSTRDLGRTTGRMIDHEPGAANI